MGLDPARASLDVARKKRHSAAVTWVHGDANQLVGRGLAVDLVMMTGNVAQVFVLDEDWACTLDVAFACLRPGGWLVFETRRPEARDWEQWDVNPTTVNVPGGQTVVVTRTVTNVAMPLVTFETTTIVGGEVVPSSSTLRFRQRDDVETDLRDHGFEVLDVRDAPDRPGKELVFIARRPSA